MHDLYIQTYLKFKYRVPPHKKFVRTLELGSPQQVTYMNVSDILHTLAYIYTVGPTLDSNSRELIVSPEIQGKSW